MKTFILYDEAIAQRELTRVRLSGLSLARFKKNPVMLYMHQRVSDAKGPAGSEVIGRWTKVRVQNGQLLAEAIFDKRDPWAVRIADKVQQGFLRGASIGISVIQSQEKKEAEQTYLEIKQSVLLEASIVDIPQNENALSNQCLMYETLSYLPKAIPSPAVLSAAAVRAALGLEGTQAMSSEALIAHIQALANQNALDTPNTLSPFALQTALGIKGKPTPEELLDRVEQLVKQAKLPLAKPALAEEEANKGRTPSALAHFLNNLHASPEPPVENTSQYAYLLKHQPDILQKLQREQPNEFQRLLQTHLRWKQQQIQSNFHSP